MTDEDIREIRNDIAEIKRRIGTLERVAIAGNIEALVRDVESTVGGSPVRAAVLRLCREEQTVDDLLQVLKIPRRTLSDHLARLERGDLLVSKVSSTDRRRKIYVRTPLCEKLCVDRLFRSLWSRVLEEVDGET